ncbi:ATP-binding protein [Terrihabitans sp. B22-R8]|uniref:ATP-binding protein n=1 Tax=Terrihabitans sp. B22-R8 TaxID=3425128 RepID=UPI00403C5150
MTAPASDVGDKGSLPADLLAEPIRPQPAHSAEQSTGRKNLSLLIQLRWLAVAGQIAAIFVAQSVLRIDLPLAAMSAILAALVALNIAGLVRLRRGVAVSNAEMFATLAFDVAALTAQLYLSGGATNPFSSLYLLQVTLGAVLLNAGGAWAMVVLIGLCFVAINMTYRPMMLPADIGTSPFQLHLEGQVIAFVLIAVLLVIFVTRINRNVHEREVRLADLRQRAAEEDHIVRMGLLASGAAHELGTPLATLAVILSDWRRMPALMDNDDLRQDIEAMQAEVRRCKAIVGGTLLAAGETSGESAGITTLGAFFDGVIEEWRTARRPLQFVYRNTIEGASPIAAHSALRQAIVNVLDNAIEASPHWLECVITRDEDRLIVTVSDDGPGFPPALLERIGTPYQSTKGREGGGIGLFLVANVLRKLGGELVARNRTARGARIVLSLPLGALTLEPRRGDAH